jgi:hypothetical protein
MMSTILWIVGLWIFGALFLSKPIRRWRQAITDNSIKSWIVAGGVGCFGFIIKGYLDFMDHGATAWHVPMLCAVSIWVMVLALLESATRDIRARSQQMQQWEARRKATPQEVRRHTVDKAMKNLQASAAQDPELLELLKLEAEDEAASMGRAADTVAKSVVIGQEHTQPAEPSWPINAAKITVKGNTTTVDLTELFFRQKQAAGEAPAPAPTQAPAPLHAQASAAPAAQHKVDLGVASRFGSGAPAQTAPVTQSVRLTHQMESSPTIEREASTAVQHSKVLEPDAIALPQTAMPHSGPVSTAPGSVQGMSSARVLGPTTLGGGRFTYVPRMVESRLGGSAPKPPQPPAPGPGAD